MLARRRRRGWGLVAEGGTHETQDEALTPSQAHARQAAREALRAHAGGTTETLALYVWGGLAFVSVLTVGAVSFAPVLSNLPTADPAPALRAEAPARPTVPPAPRIAVVEDPVATAPLRREVRTQTPDTVVTGSVEPTVEVGGMLGATIATGRSLEGLMDAASAFARRDPGLFEGLTARLAFDETDAGLAARVVAGPFPDATAVARFCRRLRLSLTADCAPAPFEGEELPVELLRRP